MDIGMMSYL